MALAITVVSDIDEVFNLYETPQQALEIAETTKATGRRLNDRRQYALGLIKGADANAELDALDAAMAEISEAQALCKDLKYEEGRAAMMNAAVKVHMKQQDMEKAYNLARDVVKLFQKLGYRKGEGVGLVTLANVYTARLNADQVIKAGQEALEIFKEIGAQNLLDRGLSCADGRLSHQRRHIQSSTDGVESDSCLQAIGQQSQRGNVAASSCEY